MTFLSSFFLLIFATISPCYINNFVSFRPYFIYVSFRPRLPPSGEISFKITSSLLRLWGSLDSLRSLEMTPVVCHSLCHFKRSREISTKNLRVISTKVVRPHGEISFNQNLLKINTFLFIFLLP